MPIDDVYNAASFPDWIAVHTKLTAQDILNAAKKQLLQKRALLLDDLSEAIYKMGALDGFSTVLALNHFLDQKTNTEAFTLKQFSTPGQCDLFFQQLKEFLDDSDLRVLTVINKFISGQEIIKDQFVLDLVINGYASTLIAGYDRHNGAYISIMSQYDHEHGYIFFLEHNTAYRGDILVAPVDGSGINTVIPVGEGELFENNKSRKVGKSFSTQKLLLNNSEENHLIISSKYTVTTDKEYASSQDPQNRSAEWFDHVLKEKLEACSLFGLSEESIKLLRDLESYNDHFLDKLKACFEKYQTGIDSNIQFYIKCDDDSGKRMSEFSDLAMSFIRSLTTVGLTSGQTNMLSQFVLYSFDEKRLKPFSMHASSPNGSFLNIIANYNEHHGPYIAMRWLNTDTGMIFFPKFRCIFQGELSVDETSHVPVVEFGLQGQLTHYFYSDLSAFFSHKLSSHDFYRFDFNAKNQEYFGKLCASNDLGEQFEYEGVVQRSCSDVDNPKFIRFGQGATTYEDRIVYARYDLPATEVSIHYNKTGKTYRGLAKNDMPHGFGRLFDQHGQEVRVGFWIDGNETDINPHQAIQEELISYVYEKFRAQQAYGIPLEHVATMGLNLSNLTLKLRTSSDTNVMHMIAPTNGPLVVPASLFDFGSHPNKSAVKISLPSAVEYFFRENTGRELQHNFYGKTVAYLPSLVGVANGENITVQVRTPVDGEAFLCLISNNAGLVGTAIVQGNHERLLTFQLDGKHFLPRVFKEEDETRLHAYEAALTSIAHNDHATANYELSKLQSSLKIVFVPLKSLLLREQEARDLIQRQFTQLYSKIFPQYILPVLIDKMLKRVHTDKKEMYRKHIEQLDGIRKREQFDRSIVAMVQQNQGGAQAEPITQQTPWNPSQGVLFCGGGTNAFPNTQKFYNFPPAGAPATNTPVKYCGAGRPAGAGEIIVRAAGAAYLSGENRTHRLLRKPVTVALQQADSLHQSKLDGDPIEITKLSASDSSPASQRDTDMLSLGSVVCGNRVDDVKTHDFRDTTFLEPANDGVVLVCEFFFIVAAGGQSVAPECTTLVNANELNHYLLALLSRIHHEWQLEKAMGRFDFDSSCVLADNKMKWRRGFTPYTTNTALLAFFKTKPELEANFKKVCDQYSKLGYSMIRDMCNLFNDHPEFFTLMAAGRFLPWIALLRSRKAINESFLGDTSESRSGEVEVPIAMARPRMGWVPLRPKS